MWKKRILGFAAALAVFSCSPSGSSPSGVPRILMTVPSDAIAVCAFGSLQDALEQATPTDSPLRRLDAGSYLSGRPAAVAYVYNGSLCPILSLDAGKGKGADDLLHTADSLGMCCARIDSCFGHNPALLFSCSQNALASAARHITDAQESILSATLFEEAAALADGRDCIILKNERCDKYLQTGELDRYYKRADVAGFFSRFAPWTVLVRENEGYDILAVPTADTKYFSKLSEKLECRDSRIGAALPDSVDFAICLNVGGDFRSAYEEWMDGCVRLDRYNRKMTALKKDSGTSPKVWEKENGISEIAAAAWDSHKVLLVRSSATGPDSISGNPCRGFISELYGAAFTFPDTLMVADGEWTAYGLEDDLRAWLEAPKAGDEGVRWPVKGNRFAVCTASGMIYSDNKGIHLNFNN